MPETVYLIDVYSLVFQVFHAIPEMTSPRGLPTNAAFGFTRDILNILRQKQPTHLICASDPPGPGEREAWYPQYKAHRSETPESLVPQFPMVQELIRGFGIPLIEIPGWEADDVLATLATQAEARQMDVRIVSNDKDLRQLLSDRVQIYQVRKDLYLNAADLLADWGVRPDQVIDFQSLVGDSVDNVPGVPLIGPKKATALLQQWGTLDEVLAHADEAPGAKLKENLRVYADQARISRRLVTLRRDLPIDFDWNHSRIGQWNVSRLQELFHEYGFRRFGDEVRALSKSLGLDLPPPLPVAEAPAPAKPPAAKAKSRGVQQSLFPAEPRGTATSVPAPRVEATLTAATQTGVGSGDPEAQTTEGAEGSRGAEGSSPAGALLPAAPRRELVWTVVDTPEALQLLARELESLDSFCLDLETTGLDPLQAEIVGWALSRAPHRGWYIPVRGPAGARTLDNALVCETLRPLLENPQLHLVNQNIKYDLLVLRQAGIRVTGLGLDPMIGHYLLEAGARSHGLDELARQLLGHEMIPISQLIGKGKTQKRMDEVDVDLVAQYAVEDAEVAWDLAQQIAPRLQAEGLWDLYWNLERPLIGVLVEMQAQGIRLEIPQLVEQSERAARHLDELRIEIHQLAGHEFNLDSPKQLQQVLFQELGLPVLKKTQTGASTDQEVLEQLAIQHDLPARMLDYRQLTKLKGTYLDALPALVNPRTGRLHCSFSQVAAATGRLSASDPNLQNVPIRTPEGRLIRRAFTPSEPGWKLVCADYSQIELRMLAHFSEDPALCESFRKGDDVHTAVAAEVFGVAPGEVTEAQRRMAKGVNFGVIYGQSAFGLATALQIPRGEAATFIEGYFARYSGVDRYFRQLLDECAAAGRATTILGRRRPIEGIRTGASAEAAGRQRNLAERTAINTVIQGSAADLIKQAMLLVTSRLAASGLPARLLLQIHDELVLEARAEDVPAVARLVRDAMTQAMTLKVPLKVDVTSGDNWLDQEDFEDE
ncbi:MAG TPA: DNA polymerase I [Planctomycetaceae bacterium]|nr:DNA polymerase I [Planctomycetaceae bacterium]